MALEHHAVMAIPVDGRAVNLRPRILDEDHEVPITVVERLDDATSAKAYVVDAIANRDPLITFVQQRTTLDVLLRCPSLLRGQGAVRFPRNLDCTVAEALDLAIHRTTLVFRLNGADPHPDRERDLGRGIPWAGGIRHLNAGEDTLTDLDGR